MELSLLADRLRCPSCENPLLERGPKALTCGRCGTSLPIEGSNINAAVGEPVLSAEWEEMQAGSVERYQDEHYEEDETIAQIFGGFIAVSLKPGDVLFDVGCGLFPHLPAYARDLQMGGYVGLEPLTTPLARDYACLTGAVAEKLPLKDESFDAALLATSLDHIEHVDQAMAELKRILRPGGRLYFWVGLHEPEMVSHAKTFHNIFYRGRGLKRAARIAAAPLEYGWFMWKMRQRRRALAKGIPLDHAHFRYYTQASLKAELDGCGLETVRTLHIPGTSSMLIEAKPA